MITVKLDKLKELMNARSWRLEDLAAASGLSQKTIYNLSVNEPVSTKTITKILAVFDMPFDELFEVVVPEMAAV